MWSRRTFCDCLQEMRAILATIDECNYKQVAAHLSSLIEENQTYGNRMGAGLGYQRTLVELHEECSELSKKVKAQKKELGIKESDFD